MLLKGTSRRQSSSGMLSIVLFMVVMAVRRVSAFVVTTTSSQPSLLPHSTVVEGRTSSPCRTSSSSLEMMMMGPTTESWMMASNNLWISTIDADIANISNDQFGLVFAGGIVSNRQKTKYRETRERMHSLIWGDLIWGCHMSCVWGSTHFLTQF